MASMLWATALPRPTRLCVLGVLAIAVSGVLATPAAAYLPQSWNGYHWARTGPLQLALGDNVSATWKPFFTKAAQQWSTGNANLSFAPTVGATSASTCSPVYGTVQACSSNYGASGWLGYATVWTGGGGFIRYTTRALQGRVRGLRMTIPLESVTPRNRKSRIQNRKFRRRSPTTPASGSPRPATPSCGP